MLCVNCNKETSNPKFCSRSCSATYTNKIKPKRKRKDYFCKVCSKLVSYKRHYCDNCNPNIVNWNNITYKEAIEIRKYQVHSRIRELARLTYKKSNNSKECYICGYNTHIEICHIKSISSFNDNDYISLINDISNLVALCPNHHWELDNNILSLYPKSIYFT